MHATPKDLRDALNTPAKSTTTAQARTQARTHTSTLALATWKDITPLARNEWICWVTSAKKEETRKKRIEVALSKLSKGMRRPCCWAGCPHR